MESIETKLDEEIKVDESAPKKSKKALRKEQKKEKWLQLKDKIKKDQKVSYFFVSCRTIELA
jgi:hypothetical protein